MTTRIRSDLWLVTRSVALVATAAACGENTSEFGAGGSSPGGVGGAMAGAGGTAAGVGGSAGDSPGGMGPAGSAGTGAPGGAAGSGVSGSGGMGGAAGSSGSAGSSGNAGAGGAAGANPVTCSITTTASVSSSIATAGIVTFSTDLAGITDARIEFGLTTSYGITAPVNLAQPSYRTLLLGMKQSSMYHYRVVVRAGQNECAGADQTLATGALTGDVVEPEVTTIDAAALAGGYLVGTLQQAGAAFILDADGDVVWWFESSNASRGMLSADSQYLWLLTTNQSGGSPNVRRVAMDGMGGAQMHPEFGDAHHDLVVLPDDTVGFMQYYMNGRDRIMERAPDGTVREIVDIPTAHGGSTQNHSNSIQYYAPDDAYTVSDLDQNCYVKVSRQGQVAWVLGGDTSDFTGPGAEWNREHGHQLIDSNRILFFNNGSQGQNSIIREVTLDLAGMTAANTWQYDGGENSNTLGDAQRLWNGNTLATYSNEGVLHEVNAAGVLVQTISFGAGVGYMSKRQSLYGPPAKQAPP